MRRRDVREACSRVAPPCQLQVEAVVVDRHRHRRRAGREERAPRSLPARVLHPDRVARVEEDPRGEVDGLLRACDDDHLVGRARHAAAGDEIGGDRLAELRQPLRPPVVEEACRRSGRQVPVDEPAPDAEREQLERRDARVERQQAAPRAGRHGLALDDQPAARGDHRASRARGPGRRHGARAEQAVGDVLRDVRARADPRLDVALDTEAREGLERRVPADRHLLAEIPRRRHLHPRAKPLVEDCVAQRAVELVVQRPAGSSIEWREQQLHGRVDPS